MHQSPIDANEPQIHKLLLKDKHLPRILQSVRLQQALHRIAYPAQSGQLAQTRQKQKTARTGQDGEEKQQQKGLE
jgi:hypothetical protein